MLGVELVADRETKRPFPPAWKVSQLVGNAALERGLVTYPLMGTVDGVEGDHMLFTPPLTITEDGGRRADLDLRSGPDRCRNRTDGEPASTRNQPRGTVVTERHSTLERPLRFVVFGGSIASDWGNPAATSTRAVLSAIARAGHEVTFLEQRGNHCSHRIAETSWKPRLQGIHQPLP